MDLTEKKQAEELVYDGTLLKIWRTKVILADGTETFREWINHPGASAVIPVFTGGDTLLVRQFRYPIGRETLEIPAGKLDPDETPLVCAARELSEETGLVGGELLKVGSVMTTPGFTNEVIHIFVCRDPLPGPAHPDEGEFVNGLRLSVDEVFQRIMEGRIQDGKTIIAFLFARAQGLL
ncbi:MAG TPA: NUDIX hydrolase [Firmicutes bacterium]|jgi:ADP-ribose pyrophosphatase|nr:NUDIX hydrolase [Bacillota bacterium]